MSGLYLRRRIAWLERFLPPEIAAAQAAWERNTSILHARSVQEINHRARERALSLYHTGMISFDQLGAIIAKTKIIRAGATLREISMVIGCSQGTVRHQELLALAEGKIMSPAECYQAGMEVSRRRHRRKVTVRFIKHEGDGNERPSTGDGSPEA